MACEEAMEESRSLRDLSLRISYRTGRDDLVRDFFVPCLEASGLYRRAPGYFTSAGFALAAPGVASLAHRGGRMRLVVSPHLEADDIAALERVPRRIPPPYCAASPRAPWPRSRMDNMVRPLFLTSPISLATPDERDK